MQMQSVAIGWYLYDVTRDPLSLGYAALFLYLVVAHTALTAPFYAVLALSGAARAFSGPAQQSFTPFLVPREQFGQAVAWSGSTSQIAMVLGPALGGLIYLAGPWAPFAACLAVSPLVALAMLSIRVRVSATRSDASALERVVAGLKYLRRQPVVLSAITLDLFAVLLGSVAALLPIYARDILHVVMGAADMISVFVRSTVVQLGTPDDMRGRVSTVHMLFIGAANEFGDFRAGLVAAWLGAVPAVLPGGICTLAVVALWTRLFPALRRVDRLSDVSPARSPARG
jgi:hypothetical protein